MSLFSAQGWRWLAGGTAMVIGANFSYNWAKRNGMLASDLTHHHVRSTNLPDDDEPNEYDELMARLNERMKRTGRGPAPPDADKRLRMLTHPRKVSPDVTKCMRQYQEDHPGGYKLWDAIEHCGCEIPPEFDDTNLRKIFVRSQDAVSEELTRMELQIIGARPHLMDRIMKPIKWEDAMMQRTWGLPRGMDPDKPYNELLVRVYAFTHVTGGPFTGLLTSAPYYPTEMFSHYFIPHETYMSLWEDGRES